MKYLTMERLKAKKCHAHNGKVVCKEINQQDRSQRKKETETERYTRRQRETK